MNRTTTIPVTALDRLPAVIRLELDRDDAIVEAGGAARALLGLAGDRLIGRRLTSLLTDASVAAWKAIGSAAPGTGAAPRVLHLGGTAGEARTLHCLLLPCEAGTTVIGTPDIDEERGLHRELLELNNELTNLMRENARKSRELSRRNRELEDAYRRIDEMARTDPLTGVLNRRGMDEMVRREMHRAERNGQPLTLGMMDLDHFKAINDDFGHDAGDAVLRTVGALLNDNLRPYDVAARLGGEEFVFLLSACDLAQGTTVAERLRGVLARTRIEGVSRPVTMSIGVTPLRPREGLEAALRRADSALYDAKQAGRDRVAADPGGGEESRDEVGAGGGMEQ
jgi:diguanylate cyclase (GGDEF)-like protein